jgi:hypothetical protein
MNDDFDCVAAKHTAAGHIREKLKGLSVRQRLGFWKKQERALAARRRSAVRKAQRPTPARLGT